MNNFIWLRFNPNEPLWKDKNLSNADIGRVVHLGTQIDYKNNLIFNNNEPITKKNMNCLFHMGSTGFKKFFQVMLDNEILYMPDDYTYKDYNYILNRYVYNNLMLNKEIIRKGTSNKHWNEQTNKDRIKLYNNAINHLIEEKISYHRIGYIMKLIPYLDYRDNSISIDKAMTVLGYSIANKDKLIKLLSNIPYIKIEKSYISISKKLIFYKGHS